MPKEYTMSGTFFPDPNGCGVCDLMPVKNNNSGRIFFCRSCYFIYEGINSRNLMKR